MFDVVGLVTIGGMSSDMEDLAMALGPNSARTLDSKATTSSPPTFRFHSR